MKDIQDPGGIRNLNRRKWVLLNRAATGIGYNVNIYQQSLF